MADDKDNAAPDPWADLDSGKEGDGGDVFSFSFDAVEEQPAEEPTAAEGFSLTTDDADIVAAGMVTADAPKSPAPDVDDATLDDLASDWLAAAPGHPADAGGSADAGSDDDPFAFVTADRNAAADASVEASLAGGSSTVEIGTGESGVVSESDIVTGADSAAGASEEAEASAVLAFGEEQSGGEATGDDDEPSGEGLASGAEEAAAMLAGAGAAAASKPAKRGRAPAKPTRKKQGAIGQLVGVVLGGLMALPITYAILVWGFGKDPFKFTKKVPPELAFLLPEKFQPGFRPGGLPQLDDVAAVESPADEPEASTPPAEHAVPADLDATDVAATENAPAETVEPTVPAQPPEPPAPPPLDLSAIERAVSVAGEAIDAVAAADATDPGRKKLLKNCYLKLADVGEELAVLEAAASDTGRPLAAAPEAIDTLYARIAKAEGLFDDLERVCRDWLTFRKRPANGVLLVAKLDDVRKVGPYWSSTASVTMTDGSEKKVSVLSRIEPRAAAGDRAVVAGVVFGDDVVWATDCRSVDAVTGGVF